MTTSGSIASGQSDTRQKEIQFMTSFLEEVRFLPLGLVSGIVNRMRRTIEAAS
jgi:hypothetical protein